MIDRELRNDDGQPGADGRDGGQDVCDVDEDTSGGVGVIARDLGRESIEKSLVKSSHLRHARQILAIYGTTPAAINTAHSELLSLKDT